MLGDLSSPRKEMAEVASSNRTASFVDFNVTVHGVISDEPSNGSGRYIGYY
jgi:hypothetical protein